MCLMKQGLLPIIPNFAGRVGQNLECPNVLTSSDRAVLLLENALTCTEKHGRSTHTYLSRINCFSVFTPSLHSFIFYSSLAVFLSNSCHGHSICRAQVSSFRPSAALWWLYNPPSYASATSLPTLQCWGLWLCFVLLCFCFSHKNGI